MLTTAALFLLLGDPRWDVRDAAEWELVRLVNARPWDYGPRLERLAGQATEPEVAFRMRRPLRVYACWQANSYVPKTVPVWPVCDCYPVAGADRDGRDRQAVRQVLTLDYPAAADRGPYWRSWRAGTERMARQMIREGRTRAEVDALLLRMWRLEIEAGSDCNAQDTLRSWEGRPWAGGYPEVP